MGSSEINIEDQYNEYNKEPVIYCAKCLSLAIREIDGEDYCDKCGSTEIKSCTIYEWENMYQKAYGKKYLIKNRRF